MRELMQFLPVLVIVITVVSMVRNAAKIARRTGQPPPVTPRSAADYDPALADRTRRIQEEIRRKIAERRGQTVATEVQPVGPRMEPPAIYREERTEPTVAATYAVLERQQQLADQMRALAVARATAQRRAEQVSAGLKTEADSSRGQLVEARTSLLAGLRDPTELRRAFVLREILGSPVGLR